jgi:hypothetical protein
MTHEIISIKVNSLLRVPVVNDNGKNTALHPEKKRKCVITVFTKTWIATISFRNSVKI